MAANDIKSAEKTYEGFVGMVKWSTVAVALIVALVIYLIT
ncbi:hypothetical protein FHS61_002448 [Altererythrobacter atlanticus]|uniref:Bacterial aa3 type cytochrome c oxidase subunit IV n=1 Tax=Croceibacterium atlanticum TaxID=1267766 RepID=A0A0F7KR16_9SPHN|nr:aa3-type cytochrome c oxidase subunit IV [Croceibacterium atlanticum]AKH42019.1 Bacterial aa3 type cytochrome c oxidase subunit IV [Croceibacterium atlanticum]MBB5733413.1 hypothetical protein [Croceibacterium atlanticum]